MIKLQSLTLKSHSIQSPMAGCTDLAFRLLAREYGLAFAFMEMVSATALIWKSKKTFRLLKTAPEDKPIGAQLVGHDPDHMAEAASMIESMGVDLLDLNLGCPVPKITSLGGGAALLSHPRRTRQIFRKIVKQIKHIPVTAKLRKGFLDPSGAEAIRTAKIAEEEGLHAITIHGRMRSQGYSGKADWKIIERIKNTVKIPVWGNGDVTCPEDAQRLIESTGCDAVMIGRAALGNPWIYQAVESALQGHRPPPKPTLQEIENTARRHLKLEIQTAGEKWGILKSRRIVYWYFKNFPNVSKFRDRINRCRTAYAMEKIVEDFCHQPPTRSFLEKNQTQVPNTADPLTSFLQVPPGAPRRSNTTPQFF